MMTTALDDSVETSSFEPSEPDHDAIAAFNPVARARRRTKQLPSNRYRFRSPKYYRGPLHPHQPPAPSSPVSREFVPGPFSLPRHLQYFTSTIAHDLMVLSYKHTIPGTPKSPSPERLRSWDDSSPYHKNRPLRGPRGTASLHLPLLRRDVRFTGVPQLQRITVSMMVPGASKEPGKLVVAGFVLQNLTGHRAEVRLTRRPTPSGIYIQGGARMTQKVGEPIAVKVELSGESMWHFFDTLTSIVLPRIKDWGGLKGSNGDRSGNFNIGMKSDIIGAWPEIAFNYDSYPPKMIPDVQIALQTSATGNRDGRLLLAALGVPFQRGGSAK